MKRCAFCGKELVMTEWEKRRRRGIERTHCDRRCANRKQQVNPKTTRYRRVKVDGRIRSEHRVVMEQHLGRKLAPYEYVHHINGDKLDNRIENLEVVSAATHGLRHSTYPVIKTCAVCGMTFAPHPTMRRLGKTCGEKCGKRLGAITRRQRRSTSKQTPT